MKMKKPAFSDIPLSLGDFSLETLSNREVTVEGSRGVLSYSEELIKVNAEKLTLCFYGRGLRLKYISSSALVISGYLTRIEFDS